MAIIRKETFCSYLWRKIHKQSSVHVPKIHF